jgi:integrase
MAIDWYEFMQANGLAQTTSRKMVSVQRHVFKRAVKAQILVMNPFSDDELPVNVGSREKQYIDMDLTNRVLQILPSVEWRAVFVMARIAGLRVQCEAPLIKWEQIDWEHNSMTFYSPKTKSRRTVPLFPDLRRVLEDLLEVTGDGHFILNALRHKSKNWRKPLNDMLQRAGIEPWSDLWNSLRASAATDIAREFGSACESEWVGHSEQTALQHCRRATPHDHEQAIKSRPKTYQLACPQRADKAVSGGTKSQQTCLLNVDFANKNTGLSVISLAK